MQNIIYTFTLIYFYKIVPHAAIFYLSLSLPLFTLFCSILCYLRDVGGSTRSIRESMMESPLMSLVVAIR